MPIQNKIPVETTKCVTEVTKVNKHKKKTWKKHINIADVEEYLEDKRQEERLGGSLEEKPDKNIFFLQKEKKTTAATIKRSEKPLRCFQNLLPDSSVPPPIKLCQTQKSTKIVTATEEQIKRRLKKLSRRQSQPSRNYQLRKPKDVKERHNFIRHSNPFDLWNDDASKVTTQNVKVPIYRYQKPSLLPCIELPHAGMSYNPSFEAHQELLQEAHEKEVKKVIDEERLHNMLTKKFPTVNEAPTEASWLEEMSQGLFDEPDVDSDNDSESKNTLKYSSIVQENRKPKSKRRREIEKKVKERKLKELKLSKRRMNSVYKLKQLRKEIQEAAKISAMRQEQKAELEREKMYQPRKIGRHKYQEPDLELNLSEELSGSLRTMKAEGNLVEDRYKSFQRRNIIEPRIRQKMKRKYKLKVFEKKGHKSVTV